MSIASNQPMRSPVLIGREREQAYLQALIDQVRQGQGQMLLLSGEAGIGKSRLLAEAKTYAASQGFLMLQGCCFPTDTSCPYAPMLDLLRSFLAHPSNAKAATDLKPFARALLPLLPDLMLLFPDPPPLLQLASPDPEQEKRRLFEALTQFLTRQTLTQPVLLIVEDVHWSDDTSLEYLHYLARRCTAHPLLVLLTYRSEEVRSSLRQWLAECDRERLATELALSPLTRSHVDEMLQVIFDAQQPINTEALEALYTLTEGNPFFIEEVMSSLIATGDIFYAHGAWDGKPFRELRVPRSIQNAVELRTERLSMPARELLALAAVAGQRFDYALLQHLLQHDEHQMLQLMKELMAAQLVVEESAQQFAFRHALTRQAISAELLVRERKALHRTIAETMEQLYATTRDAHLADLAYHFYEAGMWVKALEYEQRAGDMAQSLYAPRAATLHLTHALDAAHQLHVTAPAQIYLVRGQAYQTLGEFDRAYGDYEHALAAARDAHDVLLEWKSMMALGFLWAARDYTQAGAWFRRASELAERLDDPTLRARSLNRFGNWLANTGQNEEALQAHQEALSIFEQQQDKEGMAESLDLLGPTYGMRGERIKAVKYIGKAIALFRTLDDSQSLISSLAMRAIQSMPGSSITTFSPLRTRDACVHDAEEALRLARHTDSLEGQAFAEASLAHTLIAFGEIGPALSHAKAALRIANEIEHRQWMISSYSALGHVYLLLLGPDTEALTAFQAGLSLAQGLGSAYWNVALIAWLGHVYTLNHNLSQAQATLQAVMPREQLPQTIAERHIALAWGELTLAKGEPDTALRIAEHLLASVPGLVPDQPAQPIPHLLKLKGEALLAISHLDEAVAALEEAREGAVARKDRPILCAIHRVLGQAYRLLRRDEQARQEQALARQVIEELASTVYDASLREQFLQRELDSLPQEKPPLPREVAKQSFGGLTTREREVAALVAQGKTSRQIADLLVVSERTAEGHVNNILGKLGFTSRAQIAVWVVEQGLMH